MVHVHLTAPRHELETRYAKKRSGIKESGSYSALLRSATESNVDELGKQADLVFDTAETSLNDEVAEVVRRLDQAHS